MLRRTVLFSHFENYEVYALNFLIFFVCSTVQAAIMNQRTQSSAGRLLIAPIAALLFAACGSPSDDSSEPAAASDGAGATEASNPVPTSGMPGASARENRENARQTSARSDTPSAQSPASSEPPAHPSNPE